MLGAHYIVLVMKHDADLTCEWTALADIYGGGRVIACTHHVDCPTGAAERERMNGLNFIRLVCAGLSGSGGAPYTLRGHMYECVRACVRRVHARART